MYRETEEQRKAKEIGYELAFIMQNKRKLFQFTNQLINELAKAKPEALITMAKMLKTGVPR